VLKQPKVDLKQSVSKTCNPANPPHVEFCYGVFVIDEIKPLGIGKKKFTNLSLKDLEFAKKLFQEEKIQLLCQNCSAIKTWKNDDILKGQKIKENPL